MVQSRGSEPDFEREQLPESGVAPGFAQRGLDSPTGAGFPDRGAT